MDSVTMRVNQVVIQANRQDNGPENSEDRIIWHVVLISCTNDKVFSCPFSPTEMSAMLALAAGGLNEEDAERFRSELDIMREAPPECWPYR